MKAFRKSYFKLAELRSLFTSGKPVLFVVLTATALPEVERTIIVNLQLRSVLRLSASPECPNLRYTVLRVKADDPSEIFGWLLNEVKENGVKSRRVIIFCQTHRHCRSLYRMFDTHLNSVFRDHKTRPYAMFHAGTEEEVKAYIIQSVTSANGTVRVLFATTAFGMGVDCKELHLVIHFGSPIRY